MKQIRILGLSLILLLGLLFPAGSMAAAPVQAAGPSAPGAAGLADFLAADGSLQLPAGYSGSLNPAGYRMELGANGAPRFLPSTAETATAAPAINPPTAANWSDLFHLDGVDGEINAFAAHGTDLYVAGGFTTIDGKPYKNIAKWNGSAWSPVGFGLDSVVYDLVFDNAGNLYVGGFFTGYYTDNTFTSTNPVQHIAKWNGSAWDEVGFGVSDVVSALALGPDGKIYAAGFFHGTFVDASYSTYDAAENVSAWDPSGGSWGEVGYGLGGFVNDITFDSNGNLFAGGNINSIWTDAGHSLSIAVHYIARWHSGDADWSAVGSGSGEGLDGVIHTLAADGSEIYAGGMFANFYDETGSPSPAQNVAKWNGLAWSAMDTGFNNEVSQIIIPIPGNIYAAGSFTASSGGATPLNHLAWWDGLAWQEISYGVDGAVNSLFDYGPGKMYVSGVFTGYYTDAAHTQTGPANHLATLASGTWDKVGGGQGINKLSGFANVETMAVDAGGNLYIGGSFTAAGSTSAQNIARWDGSSWSEVGFGLNGDVRALLVNGSDLYVGGSFSGYYTSADHSTTGSLSGIGRWDGSSWHELGFGVSGTVYALALDGTKLYAAGDFSDATSGGGTTVSRKIAMWDGAEWNSLGYGFDSSIFALAVDGSGNLYAAGNFWHQYTDDTYSTDPGSSVAMNYIAMWNGASWSSLGDGLSDIVMALVYRGGKLYAGGYFNYAYNPEVVTVNRIAQWNGTAWSGVGYGFDGRVYTLAFDSFGRLYAGGEFGSTYTDETNTTTTITKYVASFDGTQWNALNQNTLLGFGPLFSLQPLGGYVYIGGNFTTVGETEKPSSYIARWTAPEYRAVSGTGSYTFYAASYPLTIAVTTRGTLAELHVQRYDESHSANAGGVPYYWQIEAVDALGETASGFHVDLTFTAPGFSPSDYTRICKFTDPGWSCAVSSHTASTVTLSDVQALSQWILNTTGPTAVTVSGYRASPALDGVTLDWQSMASANLRGFNVYRSLQADGAYARLNAALIPALIEDGPGGAEYQYRDASASPGTRYYYRLELVNLDGTFETYLVEGSYFLLRLPYISR